MTSYTKYDSEKRKHHYWRGFRSAMLVVMLCAFTGLAVHDATKRDDDRQARQQANVVSSSNASTPESTLMTPSAPVAIAKPARKSSHASSVPPKSAYGDHNLLRDQAVCLEAKSGANDFTNDPNAPKGDLDYKATDGYYQECIRHYLPLDGKQMHDHVEALGY